MIRLSSKTNSIRKPTTNMQIKTMLLTVQLSWPMLPGNLSQLLTRYASYSHQLIGLRPPTAVRSLHICANHLIRPIIAAQPSTLLLSMGNATSKRMYIKITIHGGVP